MTRSQSVVYAGAACAMKRLIGAVSADALCAMIVPESAMKRGVSGCRMPAALYIQGDTVHVRFK